MGTLRSRIDSWPRPYFAVVAAACALLVCATFYPPRIQYWRADAGHREWYRAQDFLRQCQQPLRQDVEAAVRWRLFPPITCHLLGMTGKSALVFCWAGLAIFAFALAARLDALSSSRSWSILGTIGFATSGPFITGVGWLGLNDGWYLLALLEASAGTSLTALAGWALIGTWTDERFLIALPLALLVRRRLHPAGGFRGPVLAAALGCAPYLVIRVAASLGHRETASLQYLERMADAWRIYLPYLPVGCLMGFRAGWLAIGAGFADPGASRSWRLAAAVCGVGSVVLISLLAWDLDRSTGILLPLFVLGIASASRMGGGAKMAGWVCLAANLALPYAHVVGSTVSVNSGPLGIWRALGGP